MNAASPLPPLHQDEKAKESNWRRRSSDDGRCSWSKLQIVISSTRLPVTQSVSHYWACPVLSLVPWQAHKYPRNKIGHIWSRIERGRQAEGGSGDAEGGAIDLLWGTCAGHHHHQCVMQSVATNRDGQRVAGCLDGVLFNNIPIEISLSGNCYINYFRFIEMVSVVAGEVVVLVVPV